MIKTLIFLLIAIPSLIHAASKTPTSESGIEEGMELHLFKQMKRFVLMSELESRRELTDETYSQVMLGSYYRITKRWRMGLFAQGEQGLRWDADWGKKTPTSSWGWKSSQGRWDYSSVLDSTYMSEINSRLLYEIKSRLLYYHSRDALQFRLRPGLRYFIIQEGKPVWQLYTFVEAYAPVNYGTGPIYEMWIYGGAFYQFTRQLALGPIMAFRQRWFRSYDNFENKTGEDFEITFTSVNIGLSAVYNF